MDQHTVKFELEAPYFKIGHVNAETRQVWFVLHGYGQLAQYFIRKFERLEERGICVIAPQGLSTFYLDNIQGTGRKSNRVGASWMTREHRELDIRNYVAYLDKVYQKENINGVSVTILGFSQGAATASRWACQTQLPFDRLILWAGLLAPDMEITNATTKLKGKDVRFVYGLQDPFLNDDRFSEMQRIASALSLTYRIHTFEGEHDIDGSTLERLID